MKRSTLFFLIFLASVLFLRDISLAQGTASSKVASLSQIVGQYEENKKRVERVRAHESLFFSKECEPLTTIFDLTSTHRINFFLGFFDSEEQPFLSIDPVIMERIILEYKSCGFKVVSNKYSEVLLRYEPSSYEVAIVAASTGVKDSNNYQSAFSDSIRKQFLDGFSQYSTVSNNLVVYIGHSRYGKGLDFHSRNEKFKNTIAFDEIFGHLESNNTAVNGVVILSCNSTQHSKASATVKQSGNGKMIYTVNKYLYAATMMDQLKEAFSSLLDMTLEQRKENSKSESGARYDIPQESVQRSALQVYPENEKSYEILKNYITLFPKKLNFEEVNLKAPAEKIISMALYETIKPEDSDFLLEDYFLKKDINEAAIKSRKFLSFKTQQELIFLSKKCSSASLLQRYYNSKFAEENSVCEAFRESRYAESVQNFQKMLDRELTNLKLNIALNHFATTYQKNSKQVFLSSLEQSLKLINPIVAGPILDYANTFYGVL